jgi:hypothetical protein
MSLTKLERNWARVVLETMFPSTARVPGAEAIDAGESLDEVVRTVPTRVGLGLRAALLLLVLAPLAFFKFRTLSGLDSEAREHVVLALLGSRIYVVRQLTLLLKAFGALMFIAAPTVRDKIVRPERLVKLEVRHVA